jgi:hypothetical protein
MKDSSGSLKMEDDGDGHAGKPCTNKEHIFSFPTTLDALIDIANPEMNQSVLTQSARRLYESFRAGSPLPIWWRSPCRRQPEAASCGWAGRPHRTPPRLVRALRSAKIKHGLGNRRRRKSSTTSGAGAGESRSSRRRGSLSSDRRPAGPRRRLTIPDVRARLFDRCVASDAHTPRCVR